MKKTYQFTYNRRHGVDELPPLGPGNSVRVQKLDNEKSWKTPARVVAEDVHPRSYKVETQKGIARRNRLHLKFHPDNRAADTPIVDVGTEVTDEPEPETVGEAPTEDPTTGVERRTSSGRLIRTPLRFRDI